MKMMTIVVKFEDGSKPRPVTFGDKVLGGEVTALASYDLMETMEIAETALEESTEECCSDAKKAIEKVIVGSFRC